LKWSGKFEAHLWDNTSQVEGRKRKGKHGAFCLCNSEMYLDLYSGIAIEEFNSSQFLNPSPDENVG